MYESIEKLLFPTLVWNFKKLENKRITTINTIKIYIVIIISLYDSR